MFRKFLFLPPLLWSVRIQYFLFLSPLLFPPVMCAVMFWSVRVQKVSLPFSTALSFCDVCWDILVCACSEGFPSFLQAICAEMFWSVRVQNVSQASQHFCVPNCRPVVMSGWLPVYMPVRSLSLQHDQGRRFFYRDVHGDMPVRAAYTRLQFNITGSLSLGQ